ncbi:MAG: O-antigen ligase family protein, partial [Deltaproteobacteria bacterium]|nr:O-antigen ligase family protein [Deltaproteobacteria bacterium]
MSAETERPPETAAMPNQRMPKVILFSLMAYLGMLSITQTAYGWAFMPFRWVALGILTFISIFSWANHRDWRQGNLDYRGFPKFILFCLFSMVPSILASENFSFSGFRWLSVALLVTTFAVFLRGILARVNSYQLIFIFKGFTLFLLLVSIFFPAPKTAYSGSIFQGAMGDPNSLGHVAFISALIYLHGAITSSNRKWRRIQGIIAIFSIGVMASTLARSSMTAFVVGMLLMSIFYRTSRSLLVKALIAILLVITLASPPIYYKIFGFMEKHTTTYVESKKITVSSEPGRMGFMPGAIMISREALWSESWEGFLQSPLVGWGFGMNMDSPKSWVIGITAIGMTRDITNDFLFILEGCGLFGFFGYLAFVWAIWRQSPTREQIIRIHKAIRRKQPFRPASWVRPQALGQQTRRVALPPVLSQPPPKEGPGDRSLTQDHAHALFYTLSVSIWVLFIFDGTCFSAGSLISAIFWMSTGITASLWAAATP